VKTTSAIAALALISAAACAQARDVEGFSIGLGLGYVQPKVTYDDNVSGHYRWDKVDFVPQVEAAYSKAINDKWLIGIGMTLDLANTHAGTQSALWGPVETTMKEHFSAYIQPTYALDESSAVFAKIGYHSVKVEAVGQPGANWLDDKFHIQGIGYGVGYKRFINDNFFVQAEVQFVDYRNKSFNDGFGYVWNYQQNTTAGILTAGFRF
jgi:opacity protein-like surface antigen